MSYPIPYFKSKSFWLPVFVTISVVFQLVISWSYPPMSWTLPSDLSQLKDAFKKETQGMHYPRSCKGAILCFRNPYFYFWHGESTSTASQLTSPASQKSKDLNKVSLLLQDLGLMTISHLLSYPQSRDAIASKNWVLLVLFCFNYS